MALAAEQNLVLLPLIGLEGRLEVEPAQARLFRRSLDHGRDLGVVAVLVPADVLGVGQEHHHHRHPVLARLLADVVEGGAHRLPAAHARAVVTGPVVLRERAPALVLDADLRGRVDPRPSDLLLQRAARALDELAQVELLRPLVQREQPGVQVAQRHAPLVLVQLVVRVVHRVEVHQHQVR
ncbi:MAG TPA: hypothetical protein VMR86_09100 [Myxococcota bacterium]|nr:hypothetical protein [Myxococcota bacterium]